MIPEETLAVANRQVRSAPALAPFSPSTGPPDRKPSSVVKNPVRGDMVKIVAALAREISRPLASLRSGFYYACNPEIMGQSESEIEVTSTNAMAVLCDQMLIEARTMLDSVAVFDRSTRSAQGTFQTTGLLLAVAQEFESIASARRVQLIIDWNGVGTQLPLDPEMCQRALSGLVRDAINMTPPGGLVTLRICTNFGGLTFEVIAERSGPTDQSCLRQVEESSWGPGLILARALVESLGGRIDLVMDHRQSQIAIVFSS